LLVQSGRFIGLKFAHSAIETGASVPKSLQRLSIYNTVQLLWVPGHCGIIGNEEADGLAGVGSESKFYGPEPCLIVPKLLMSDDTCDKIMVVG
jgi:hypothetical protein